MKLDNARIKNYNAFQWIVQFVSIFVGFQWKTNKFDCHMEWEREKKKKRDARKWVCNKNGFSVCVFLLFAKIITNHHWQVWKRTFHCRNKRKKIYSAATHYYQNMYKIECIAIHRVELQSNQNTFCFKNLYKCLLHTLGSRQTNNQIKWNFIVYSSSKMEYSRKALWNGWRAHIFVEVFSLSHS